MSDTRRRPDTASEPLGPPGKRSSTEHLASNPEALLDQYRSARAHFDAGVLLIGRALDLRELLWLGVLDLDDAVRLVDELRRDSAEIRRRRR